MANTNPPKTDIVYTAKATISTELEATFTEADMLEVGYQDPYAYAKDYLDGSDYTEIQCSGSFKLCYVETDEACSQSLVYSIEETDHA